MIRIDALVVRIQDEDGIVEMLEERTVIGFGSVGAAEETALFRFETADLGQVGREGAEECRKQAGTQSADLGTQRDGNQKQGKSAIEQVRAQEQREEGSSGTGEQLS